MAGPRRVCRDSWCRCANNAVVEQPAARRRPVLKAALGGVAAIGAVGAAVRVWPGADPGTGSRTLTLAGSASEGIGELEVPLDGPLLARRADDGRWETTALASTAYSMLALTWDAGETAPEAEVRTRSDGGWSDWRPVPVLADAPDAASDEESSVAGTDLMWIGTSDGVQVRVGPSRPSGLTLVLLNPWAQPGDAAAADELDVPLGRTADESLVAGRTGAAAYASAAAGSGVRTSGGATASPATTAPSSRCTCTTRRAATTTAAATCPR